MGYCLPKQFASNFLKALRDGTIVPAKLMEMSSAERRAFFEPIVGKDNAQHVNALFESKLLLKDQQRGLMNWAKSLAGIKEPVRKDLLAKIEKMSKVLTPGDTHGFLGDLAEQKLGTAVTEDEAQKIMDLAQKASKERDKATASLSGVSDEYLKAAADLSHYVKSIKPTTALASIGKNAAIIARNHLLMNPSTPVKTTAGQIVNTVMEAVGRRLGAQSANGQSADLAAQANKEAWATFRATGFNTASMESIEDHGTLGEKARFDVPEGMLSANPALRKVEGGVRAYAKLTNKIAIDWEHNISYTAFYQHAFFDMLNIGASNLAKGEGLAGEALKARADAIFRDAARIKPNTDIGAMLRLEGQKQSARVTSTNETLLSKMALAMKDGLNKAVNGLGDALMPIAKIPANVIWNGIENAGPGIPLGVKDIFQGREKIQSEDQQTRYEGMAQFANGIQRLMRVFGTLAVAAFFTSMLGKKDFRSDNYGNHFVRIGGIWINMEYINAISPALAGMMTVKKDGKASDGALRTATRYTAGALQGLKNAPGVDELSDLVTSITNSNFTKGFQKYAEDFFTSRGEPAFIQNLSKDRPINRLLFGAHGVEDQGDVNRDNAQKAATRRASRYAN